MKIEKTTLNGVFLIQPYVFEDHRGEYVELFNEKEFKETFCIGDGINIKFVEDDISMSCKNVLRGVHGDFVTWKLISCLYGWIYLVVLNCDSGTDTWGKWEAFLLSDRNRAQILIPPGYGNGHLVLSDVAVFHYKQSQYYNRERQFTVKWDDSDAGIWWPTKNPILSRRDEEGRFLDVRKYSERG